MIIGCKSEPKEVKVITPLDGEVSLDFWYNDSSNVLTIRKPGVNIAAEFEIQLVY